MEVLVTGSTGVLGKRVLPLLASAGHATTAVVRTDTKARAVRELGAVPLRLDILDAVAVRGAVTGYDAVCNLATHIPPLGRMGLPGAWRENDRIRTIASAAVAEAVIVAGIPRLVQESFALMYPDRGRDWIDEDVEPALTRNTRSAPAAEAAARRVTAAGGAGVVLRFCAFHAAETDAIRAAVAAARVGVAACMGRPGDYVSTVHIDDAAAAVVAALQAPAGTYNVGDDDPLTRRGYADAIASALGRARLRIPPRPVAALLGSTGSMLTRSQRISNQRLRAATAWAPRHRSARETWRSIAAEMGSAPR